MPGMTSLSAGTLLAVWKHLHHRSPYAKLKTWVGFALNCVCGSGKANRCCEYHYQRDRWQTAW